MSERARRHQLSKHDFTTPRDVVAWMGPVQAQDPLGARWALGIRLPKGRMTDQDVARDLDEGRIVRTHAMRFTWQLVAPEDVRWIIGLVGPRVLARAAGRHAQLGLDAKTIATSIAGHADRSAIIDAAFASRINAGGGLLAPSIVSDGTIIGTWRRTLGPRATVSVEHSFFRAKVDAAQRRAVREATERYAKFIGCEIVA